MQTPKYFESTTVENLEHQSYGESNIDDDVVVMFNLHYMTGNQIFEGV
jgi:hypothetical protein